MKVKQSEGVAFLVALGFKKAKGWDIEKVKSRLSQMPEKVTRENVPTSHEDFYQKLTEAKDETAVEAKSEKTGKSSKKEKSSKSEKKEKKAKKVEPTKPAIEKDSY